MGADRVKTLSEDIESLSRSQVGMIQKLSTLAETLHNLQGTAAPDAGTTPLQRNPNRMQSWPSNTSSYSVSGAAAGTGSAAVRWTFGNATPTPIPTPPQRPRSASTASTRSALRRATEGSPSPPVTRGVDEAP